MSLKVSVHCGAFDPHGGKSKRDLSAFRHGGGGGGGSYSGASRANTSAAGASSALALRLRKEMVKSIEVQLKAIEQLRERGRPVQDKFDNSSNSSNISSSGSSSSSSSSKLRVAAARYPHAYSTYDRYYTPDPTDTDIDTGTGTDTAATGGGVLVHGMQQSIIDEGPIFTTVVCEDGGLRTAAIGHALFRRSLEGPCKHQLCAYCLTSCDVPHADIEPLSALLEKNTSEHGIVSLGLDDVARQRKERLEKDAHKMSFGDR